MARLKSIAIGPGRGSAGDATYRQVDGRTIMSARVRTNESNTPKQAAQRNLFGWASKLTTATQPWMNVFFSKLKYGTKSNAFIRSNWEYIKLWAAQKPTTAASFVGWMFDNAESLSVGTYLAKGSAPVMGVSTDASAPEAWENADVEAGAIFAQVGNDAVTARKTFGLSLAAIRVNFPVVNRTIPYVLNFEVQVMSPEEIRGLSPAEIDSAASNGTLYGCATASGFVEVYIPFDKAYQATGHPLRAYLQKYTQPKTSAEQVGVTDVLGMQTAINNFRAWHTLLVNGEPTTLQIG